MKCPQCPYYEQKTSYGTELVKCENTDCPKYKDRKERRMTNQRLSELRHKGYITDAEYKEIKNALSAIDTMKKIVDGDVDTIIAVLKGEHK